MRNHSKGRPNRQPHTQSLNAEQRAQLQEALWGRTGPTAAVPCGALPLFAGICGSGSLRQIRAHVAGCGECPFGLPNECPGRRLADTPHY